MEGVPFLMTCCSMFSSLAWTFYGILLKNFLVTFPYVIGILISLLQVSLFCIYPRKYKGIKEEEKINNSKNNAFNKK